MITREEILAYEAQTERLEEAISKTALEVYRIRNGKSLNDGSPGYARPQYYLEKWERDGENIIAVFQWRYSGGSNCETITFPLSFL